jgi:preprotein translocase subunit SecY
MIDAFSLPDLRRRILITFGILVVFRFIAHVPLPGVDLSALSDLFESNALLGMLDMFSGGAMKNLSVVAMGVYPYITASIIMTLLAPIIPQLRELSAEGEAGQDKINRITHWLTVPLAGLSGYGQLVYLQNQGVLGTTALLPMVAMVMSLIAGTMFLVWLGERITEYGIGNGISIIIFAGIVAGYWQTAGKVFLTAEQNLFGVIVYLLIALATTVLIVLFTERSSWRAHVPAVRLNPYPVAGQHRRHDTPYLCHVAGAFPRGGRQLFYESHRLRPQFCQHDI